MNNSNIVTIIATFLIAVIFFGSVFVNLDIRKSKEDITRLEDEIDKIKIDIMRQKIEITSLTNPVLVINYIEKNGLKPVPLKNVEIIKLNEK